MKHIGYFTHSDCMIHDMGHMHPESPMRLQAIDTHLQAQGLMLDLTRFDAEPAELDLIKRAHPHQYVHEIEQIGYDAINGDLIPVDGDTSTSDTVLAFATGAAGNDDLAGFEDTGADAFAAALNDLCRQLAQLVVRDGEGASKFITVDVTGADSDESAHRVGLAIANSPLVKTAIAGEDANWGRVVMAVGKAGETADRDKLSIGFGGIWTAKDGQPCEDYDEAPVAEHLKGDEIMIAVDLGIGPGRATVWTCDLTHGYISINADYRS